MLYLLKTLIAAIVIVLTTELSKRSTSLAALLLALPIVSVISFIWIYCETKDKTKIAELSAETFWYVIPSLPMFLLFSWLLRHDVNFFIALLTCCALTAALFGVVRYFQT
ncbi:MAG: DUF3147 family protein [Burkholderiales bacterium]|nr:DUF3147 family protein [Burkholderiales bacterium]